VSQAVATAREELTGWQGHDETLAALDAAVALADEGRPTPEMLSARLGAGWVGEQALAIAVCAALVARDVGDGVLLAVNHSGDSDSTGSICGNILGARDAVDAITSRLRHHIDLRWVIEPLVIELLAEFGATPPQANVWMARYPGE
jgi:ADP-ribosylglycohydrolase